MPETLAIVGGGSWGTALACVLAPRFEQVRLWVNEPDIAQKLQSTRVNELFLPGITLPANVMAGNALEAAVAGADFVIGVMPSHVAREVYTRLAPFLTPGAHIVSATKG